MSHYNLEKKLEDIANIISHHGLKVSYKAQSNLSHLFYNAKDVTAP